MKKVFLFVLPCFLLVALSQVQSQGSSLLWRIQKPGTDSPSYLFGTIHLPQKKFVNYSDSVYSAIQNTSILYNELDFLHQTIFGDTALLNYFMEKKKYLDSVQKTDAWKRLISRINKTYNSHIDPDSPDEFLQFSQQFLNSLYQPEEGMVLPDMMLATHAMMLGKKTAGLETFQRQFDMVYALMDARLKDTTMGFGDDVAITEGLKRYYISEQVDSTGNLIDRINPNYRDLIFYQRNQTMSDSIEKHMAVQSCFFAVGAGHLGGKAGVIELLRKKGFTVTPVLSSNKMSILVVNNMLKMSGDAQSKSERDFDQFKIDTEGVKDAPKEQVQEPAKEYPPPPPPSKPPKNVQVTKQPVKTKPRSKP